MTNLINLRLVLMFFLSMAAFNVGAEETKECRYEVKLWGKLRSGQRGASEQDLLRVSVIGEMRSGDSVWYSVIRRPGTEPDLVPQIALEQPYPSGTCLSYMASIKDSLEEAWSNRTSDMIHEDDREIPAPPRAKVPAPAQHNIALGQESESGMR